MEKQPKANPAPVSDCPPGPTVIMLSLLVGSLALAIASDRGLGPLPNTLPWLLGVLLLEATAVRLPGFGFFTAAPALYLAGCADQSFGIWGLLLGLSSGALLRSRWISNRGASTPSAEIGHAIPLLASGLLLALWPDLSGEQPGPVAGVLAAAIYVFTDRALSQHLALRVLSGPKRVAWMRLRRTLLELQLPILMIAALLLVLTADQSWLPAPLALLAWSTHQTASNALFRVQATLALESERQLHKVAGDLRETRQEKRQLEGEVNQLSTLVTASRQFSSTLNRSTLLDLAAEFCRERMKAPSGGLIWGASHRAWGGLESIDLRAWLESEGETPPAFVAHRLVRLPREGEDYGSLIFFWTRPPSLSQDWLQLVEAFAYSLGMALENIDRVDQLTQAQAQLVEGNKLRAVGQLAAGVAHELNSPLGAIRLALESFSASLTSETAQRRLLRALGACNRAQGIVDKLLLYSREKPAPPEVVPLATVIDDAVLFLQPTLQERRIQLCTEIDPGVSVLGSAPELSQVVINLVLNACDAYRDSLDLLKKPKTDPSPKVEIGCGIEDGAAVLWVEDRAGGIPPAIRDRIFEPFFTTKDVGLGTGLGLSVSAQLAGAHRGELLHQQRPGGSRFLLRLPKAKDH